MKIQVSIKKLLILLLCILTVVNSIPLTAAADENDDEETDKTEVSLTMSSKTIPTGKYGETLTIRLRAQNTGTIKLLNVRITPNIDETFASVFEVVTSALQEKQYADLPVDDVSGDVDVFNFKVRTDVKTGYYPIVFNARFVSNYTGHTMYSSSTVYVYIEGEDDEEEEEKKIKFVIGENQETPFGTYPGVMDYTVNIQNKGTDTAYDVSANMVLSDDVTTFPFEISLSNYDRSIGNMPSGSSGQLAYSMALRKDVKTGYYPITFTILYREKADGELKSTEQIFYVRTKGEEEEETTAGEIDVNTVETPRLIISGYSTSPEDVKSGEEFTLTLHMQNTSKSITATNILFTLEAEVVDGNAVFTPLSGSTAVVIDSLSPGQTTDILMPMTAKAGVAQKSYTLTVNQKYDIEKLKGIKDTASVAIPVKQMAKLSIGTIEIMPEAVDVGSECNVMFGINNTGKITLYNVNVTFLSDAINEVESYVGNIEPGATGNVDAMLAAVASNMENSKIKAVISYEDDTGAVSSIEKEFDLLISEPTFNEEGDYLPVDGGEDQEIQKSFFEKYKFVFLAGAALIAVAGGVVVIKIRKKRHMEKEEEGMEDEIS